MREVKRRGGERRVELGCGGVKRREGREEKNRGGSPKWLVKMMEMQYLTSQVLAAATVIAKHTSVLCNACKVASSKTSNPVAKRHFVQAAKEVANSTANLVKNIKVSTSVCVIVCTLSTNSSCFFLPLHLFTLPSPFPSPFLSPLPSSSPFRLSLVTSLKRTGRRVQRPHSH